MHRGELLPGAPDEQRLPRQHRGERLDEYEDYVAERVLWIQSAPPIWRMPANAFTAEVRTLASAPRWSAFFRSMRESFARESFVVSMVLVGLLALLGVRGSSRRAIRREGEAARQRQQVSILPTVRALLASTILAASYAAPFLALRYLGGGVFSEDPFAAAFGLGCDRAAAAALIFGSLRVLTTPGGLAECHFEWSERSVRLVRKYSTLVLPVTPFAALAGDFLLNVATRANAAALAFLVESGSVLFFLWRVLHPSRGVLAVGASAATIADWAFRLRRLWFLVAVGVTSALLVLSLVGFGYTARNLFGRIEFSLGFLLALLVIRALALRWITLARRNEALERWRRKREEETARRLADIERRRDDKAEEVDTPDGTAIAFVMADPSYVPPPENNADDYAKNQLWMVRLSGGVQDGAAVNLTPDADFSVSGWTGNWTYDWAPDGSAIVFAHQERPGLDYMTEARLSIT